MSEAFAVFLFHTLSGSVFVAIATVSVSAAVLIIISTFKHIFEGAT